ALLNHYLLWVSILYFIKISRIIQRVYFMSGP
ncbi:hypothetical protein AZZ66_004194, partial [Escherichia coli]